MAAEHLGTSTVVVGVPKFPDMALKSDQDEVDTSNLIPVMNNLQQE